MHIPTRTFTTGRWRPGSTERPLSPVPIRQSPTYNAYTGACAPGGKYVGKIGPNHVPYCGSTTTGVAAAPCYTTGGAPVTTCTAADVANPYWNDPQPLIDPSTAFPTYSTFPGGIGSSAFAFGAPYVGTLLLNYKHDKFSITPSFQFIAGAKYGYPQSTPGIDPVTCTGVLPIAAGNGGSRYNSNTCAELGAVPDTYTGTFDGLGAFTQPANFIMSLQAGYDLSPRVTLTGALTNIVNTCWGGTPEPWTYGDHNVCGYGLVAAGSVQPVGNIYNPAGYPGSIEQPFRKYPYGALFGRKHSPRIRSTSTLRQRSSCNGESTRHPERNAPKGIGASPLRSG